MKTDLLPKMIFEKWMNFKAKETKFILKCTLKIFNNCRKLHSINKKLKKKMKLNYLNIYVKN